MQNEERIKTLLTILFVCIVSSLLSGCGFFEETICKETEGQNRNGLVYLPNQKEPFTGKNLCKYENGQNKSKGKIKDGKKNDIWTEWYENGQIQHEGDYIDGKKDAKWTWWDENGQINTERIYKEGKEIGEGGSIITRYLNGQIKSEKNYIDGDLVSETI